MKRLIPWLLGISSFVLYAWNLGAADLVTDEAKDALNVAYPHPPLVRVAMKASAAMFGHSEFGARLPSALLGAASVVLVYLLLKRIIKRPMPAVLGALAFMLLPPHLTWVRTAFLSPATEFGWLLALCGMALVHDEPARARGHWITAAGIVFGTWSNIQAVLIYPAYYAWLWTQRDRVMDGGAPAHAMSVAGLASPVVLGLYILAVRSVRDDFGRFFDNPPIWSDGLLGWLFTTPLGWCALASVAATAIYAALILAGRPVRHPALDAAALTMPFVFGLCLMSPAAYYAPYYAATGGILAIALLAHLPGRSAAIALATALIPLLLILPRAHRHAEHGTFFHENAAAINLATTGETHVAYLGPIGYQANWYMKAQLVPIQAAEQVEIKHAIVFDPLRLNDDERAFIAERLAPERSWGPATLYVPKPQP